MKQYIAIVFVVLVLSTGYARDHPLDHAMAILDPTDLTDLLAEEMEEHLIMQEALDRWRTGKEGKYQINLIAFLIGEGMGLKGMNRPEYRSGGGGVKWWKFHHTVGCVRIAPDFVCLCVEEFHYPIPYLYWP